ncbi:helix-hairpin-helix domain-containing protein [Evansella sp. AB-rgal1]|uniref:helix-hairpin-helix domain-containing protein n=1 Tax=Evansella sp. AB-rgal1 TaxID=3242696 RepID=UPI00359D0230
MFLWKQKEKLIMIAISVSCFFVGGVAFHFYTSYSETKQDADEWEDPWDFAGGSEQEMEVNSEDSENNLPYIFVDIKGEVNVPGIYEMVEGDRVFAAIEKAGGITENGEQRAINLAEKCYDEMVIYVPPIVEGGEVYEMVSVSSSSSGGKIAVNKATADELTAIPGIGPSKAAAIIQYREENGPFQKEEDLTKVPGIGEKTLDNMREFIKVP